MGVWFKCQSGDYVTRESPTFQIGKSRKNHRDQSRNLQENHTPANLEQYVTNGGSSERGELGRFAAKGNIEMESEDGPPGQCEVNPLSK